MGLTDRGRAATAGGVTLAVAGLALGFEELTRLGLLALTLPLLAAAYVTLSRPQVEIDAPSDVEAVEAGGSASFPVRISPSAGGVRTLRLDQPLPPTMGGGHAREIIPPLSARQTFTLDLRLNLVRRGRHELPTCTVTREDPLGLAARRWTGGPRRTITVYPRTHPLPLTHLPGTDIGGDGSARGLSGDEFGSIRAYRPGDDLRRIHWPVSAHRGELMTRQDERSSSRHVLVVLDPRLATPASPEVLEWGIEMVASLVTASVDGGRPVDLVTGTLSPAGRAVIDEKEEALTTLALLPTTPRPPRLDPRQPDPVVRSVREQAERAGLVVLVTGCTDRAATEDLLRTLPPSRHGVAVVVAAPGEDDAAADVRALAAATGWAAVVASPASAHAEVWASTAHGRGAPR